MELVMSNTILTSIDGFCSSQTTTTVDISWVTQEILDRWHAEALENIAQRKLERGEDCDLG
jgi:hypothetical protein